MTSNISANNYEDVRASWTAMDQCYGSVKVGDDLNPIDNSGQGQIQPWQTPSVSIGV